MTKTIFQAVGRTGDIWLFGHPCARFGCAYISAEPSRDDDPYVVPMCGCRPSVVLVSAAQVAERFL